MSPPNHTDLINAARSGDIGKIGELLAAGVNVNAAEPSSGITALHWAVYNGHKEAVERLIKAGADLEVREDRANGQVTPLIWAVELRRLDIARILLLAGADANAVTNDGNTARKAAERNNDDAMIEVLDWMDYLRQKKIDDARAKAERKAEDERQSRLHKEALQALGKPPKFKLKK